MVIFEASTTIQITTLSLISESKVMIPFNLFFVGINSAALVEATDSVSLLSHISLFSSKLKISPLRPT